MAGRSPAPAARDFLIRGLLAGLLAGLVAFAVAYLVGEPSIQAAIALEDAAPTGHSHEHTEATAHEHETVVPRSVQSTIGLLTGTVVLGVTLGGLAGVLSALALGRFGRLGVRGTALGVAAAGFLALYAVPFAAYPPNPPAVGQADTIGLRSAVFFTLLAISVIAAVAAVLTGRALAPRWGAWPAGLAAVGGYLVVAIVAVLLLPGVDEVPAGFPASLLYEFRAASFLTQFALWTTLGVALAELLHRLTRRSLPSEATSYARLAR